MNLKKSWLLAFAFCGMMAFSSFANAPTPENSPSVTKEIKKLLKGITFESAEEEHVVFVDFMINDKGELMVLSTSDKKLDKTLKSRLNYKTIEIGNLKYSTKYTLPISFKK